MCILLVHIHIVGWCTVHTTLNSCMIIYWNTNVLPSWNLTEGGLSRTMCTRLNSLPRDGWATTCILICVVWFYKSAVVWCRKEFEITLFINNHSCGEKMDLCKADKSMVQDLLEMPISRNNIPEKVKVVEDKKACPTLRNSKGIV